MGRYGTNADASAGLSLTFMREATFTASVVAQQPDTAMVLPCNPWHGNLARMFTQ